MNDNLTSFSDSSFATFSRKWAFSCLKSKIVPFSSLSLFFISISNSTKTESHKMLYLATQGTQDKVRKFTLPVSDNFFSVDSNALWIFCFSRTWFSSTCWNHLMQSLNLLLCSVICSIFAYHNKIQLIRIQNRKKKQTNWITKKQTLRSNFFVFGFSFNKASTSSFVNSIVPQSEPSVLAISLAANTSCLLLTTANACRERPVPVLVAPVVLPAPILLLLSNGTSSVPSFFYKKNSKHRD